MKRKYFWRCCM